MIVFSMSVLVRSASRAEFLQSLRGLLEPTRVVPGCLGCRLYSDIENADALVLIGEWASQPELDRYLGSDACKTLIAAMELAQEPPRIRFDEVAHSAGIEVIEAARRRRGLVQELPSDESPQLP